MTATWLTGPALDVARTLRDASVDLVATSPPFLALRDYNGVEGQWGSEPTPAAFLDNLLALATELRRVLAPHGSLAFELGDSYAGGSAIGTDARDELSGRPTKYRGRGVGLVATKAGTGWPPAKSLTGVPTLFAWSLAYGRNLLNPCHTFEPWLVRNVIVWARNNPPVGALGDKVRPATSYITVACPSPRRWFDLDAVRTAPLAGAAGQVVGHRVDRGGYRGISDGGPRGDVLTSHPAGAPPLDHWHDEYDGDHTWLINTQGSSLAHYAMWPARLAERLILAMCPREVCVGCGEPRRRLVGPTEYVGPDGRNRTHDAKSWASAGGNGNRGSSAGRTDGGITAIRPTTGWSVCACPTPTYRPGIVLDPFSGTGTTVHAAEVHGRDGIGIDLDPINATLRDRRRDEVRRNLLDVAPEVPGQLTLEALL